MRRNSELKSSVSFLKKQEFIEKAELFNSYRVGAVHRMRRTNLDTLAVELQKVKGCFDEIFDLYNDIQDDFRVIFHSLDPVKIYAQICLQTPADLKSAGNSGVVHDRL